MNFLWLCSLVAACLTKCLAASSDCENPPLDIAIVIDQTKSVGEENYDKMLDSIKSLIDKYDVGEDKTHFSIVTYAKKASVRVSLDNPKYHSNEALEELLDDMKKNDKLGSPTRTDVALKTVGEQVFVLEKGDRAESPNIMIVFTDGNTHKSSAPYDTVIPALEAAGVHRVAVGIGKDIDESELEIIAGDESRVVNAKDFGDLDNQLDDIREKTCNIDGGYTEWTEWTECTATCGGGTKRRSRTCTNPSPKNKGKTCIEQGLEPEETEDCNTQDCPEPGGYTEWSSWGECSVTCGGGVQKRTRTCTNPPPSGGGPSCVDQNLGLAEEDQECNKEECPVPGGYTEWSSWGKCSVTCGGGVQTRTRTCTNPPPSGGGPNCIEQDLGPAKGERQCNTRDCGEDGNWSPWGNPGTCDKTCGRGTRKRQRTCTNPPPSGDGEDCKGSSTKWESCNTQPCPTPEPPPPKPCKEHLDVGVIIDSSNSINPQDYSIARQYIVQLAERLEISEAGTHMAILLYSWEAHTWHRFTDGQSIEAIRSKANTLPHIRGGTRTDRALELAAEEFFGWEDSGDRPDKPNVLIVLTDGNTNEGSKPFSQVTPPLDEAQVRRVAIGIGNGINIGELREIASDKNDVLQVAQYGQLKNKLEEIMKMACEQQYPGDCDNWGGDYGSCSKTCGGGVQVRTRKCPPNSLHLKQQKRHCNTNLCPGQHPCEDTLGNCPTKAASGECWKTARPSLMFYVGKTFPLWETCKKSCRRCNVDSCQDSDPYICPWWSEARNNHFKCNYRFRQGFSIKYLREMCKKSCNQCGGGGGGEDGNWSPWGNPGTCDKTCGRGTRKRQRTCTNPPPSGDGENCKGSSTKWESCNTQPCHGGGGGYGGYGGGGRPSGGGHGGRPSHGGWGRR